tara:strand:+ start:2685 stop:3797 length:1113 start_codon:yes stop_codon:yes gene_type:complete
MISVFEPTVTYRDIFRVAVNMRSTYISGTSPVIKEFEEKFSTMCSRKYGVAVSNGSVALDLALKSVNLKSDDEVIVPAHTIISCLSAIIRSGAKPIFCDVDSQSWNMNLENVKKALTEKTKAVLMVHTFGLPSDAKNIEKFCDENKLALIEDSAEAHGQYVDNQICGSFGIVSTFSFYANKHVTTGEGGIVLTDSNEIYDHLLQMRNLDFNNSQRFKTENLFWNYRMSGLQASLGLSQIKSLSKVIQNKIEQGNYYQKLLNEYNDILITPPKELNGSKNHYWVFGIVLKNKGIRDSVMNEMHMKGIETRPFFWPLHLQPSLPEELKRKNYALTVSEDIGENGFYIPLGNHINKKIQQKIVQEMVKIIKDH